MKKLPRVLITNDDGIYAPGIQHLWRALKNVAEVMIVAPASEQSSVGLSVTLRHPLHIHKIHWSENTPAWSVSGTPADCVKMALSLILDNPPDIVVSGINRGQNAGRSVLYSGTVGGTIEAIMHNIPGIAFSCYDYDNPNYAGAEPHIPKLLEYVLQHPLPKGSLLNVNFPSQQHSLKGFKMTRQGKGWWAEDPEQRAHPSEGNDYYWLGAKFLPHEEHEEADLHALSQGYVTATPVHVSELTDLTHYSSHKGVFETYFS